MNLKYVEKGDVIVCYPEGEIRIDTVSALKDEFYAILEKSQNKILFNFAGVVYIDSLGIATLIEFYNKIKKKKGYLSFSNISPKVASILRITKIDEFFDIFDAEEEALKPSV